MNWGRRSFLKAFAGGFLAYALGLRDLKAPALVAEELGAPAEGAEWFFSIRQQGVNGDWSAWAKAVPLPAAQAEGQTLVLEEPALVKVGSTDVYRDVLDGSPVGTPPLVLGGLHPSTVYQVRVVREDGCAAVTYHYPGTPGNLDEPEPVAPLFGTVDMGSLLPLPSRDG